MKIITEEKNFLSENINKKTRAYKEVDQKNLKKIFLNLLIAIFVMIYFVSINILYKKMQQEDIVNIIKMSTLMFLTLTIALIEISYKKESSILLISAIEALVFSSHNLTIMHTIKIYNFDFQTYILTSSYIFSIYYVLKTIVIYTRGRKDYLNSLSDISEIVKKDKPIKKEAIKRNKIEEQEETKIDNVKISKEVQTKLNKERKVEKHSSKKDIKQNEKGNEIIDKEVENVLEPKKRGRGRPRKNAETQVKDVDVKTKKTNMSSKKSAKSSTTRKTTKKSNEEKDINNLENKPKKRGRPKKEVTIND